MNLSKKEKLNILVLLLGTQDISHKCEIVLAGDNPIRLDDKERYLKMAMRIDPNDERILIRKEEYKSFAKLPRTSKVLAYHLVQ